MTTQPNTPASRNEEARESYDVESILRAMAQNYRNGHHWDHLDREACLRAVAEISALRTVVSMLREALAAPGAAIDASGQEAERLIRLRKNTGNSAYEAQCEAWLASRPEAPPASASPSTVAQPVDMAQRWDAVIQLAHDLDDAAQHITERQAYEFATKFRVLAGVDGDEAADQAAQPCASQGCGEAGKQRDLTAEEHKVFRSAVRASSVLVARGRLVEVCPECDIADCHHIRERAALSTAKSGEHGATDGGTGE